MYKSLPYMLLFVATALLQIFLFDRLTISVWLSPLVYIAPVVLLPIETAPVVVLLTGFVTGATADWGMGVPGINTAATLFIAFVRHAALNLLCGKEGGHDSGVPSSTTLGDRLFFRYLLLMTAMHHAIFFVLEALSWAQLPQTLLRFVVSLAVSMLFLWIIMRLFTSKIRGRV